MGSRSCGSLLEGVFIDPVLKEARDVAAVALQHHHVIVAADPDVFEPYELRIDARLLHEARGAMVIGRMIGRFGRQDEHGNVA